MVMARVRKSGKFAGLKIGEVALCAAETHKFLEIMFRCGLFIRGAGLIRL
jgi:hypothetical protein